jgi:hypothetical protein
MAKVLEFKANNIHPFTSWIKRFSSVDNSLLLEIDETAQEFLAKTYNPEKSVVKFSRISFEDAGLKLTNKASLKARVKAGIYHIPRLMKSLEHFVSEEFYLGFKYDEIIGEDAGFVGTGILLKNSSLKMNLNCTPLHIFKYISDNLFTANIAQITPDVSFELPTLKIEKINSLCGLDNEYKFLDFKTKGNKLNIRGKSFEFTLADSGKAETGISIYKAQFEKIDTENYNVDLSDEKIVYKSKDSQTIIVTSMVVKDEKYDESIIDF